MTCFSNGTLNSPAGLLAALAIGVAFGFWLERAGFGSSRKLAAIFYFRDFAVLKVMFTAILTAAVGLYFLTSLGLADIEDIYQPATFLWPQIVGGLLFGVGFVVGGYCPGTSLVALASGKLDALVFLLGAVLGSLGFVVVYPAIQEFTVAGARGVSTLPEVLGLGSGTVTVLVVAAALGAFAVAGWVEKRVRAGKVDS